MSAAPRIAVVGTGPVGRALAAAYVAGGGEVTCVVSRDAARAAAAARETGATLGSADPADALAAEVAVLAVADRAVEAVAASLAGRPGPAALVVHTSGALPAAALRPAGRAAASLHPLRSFPGLPSASDLAARVPGTHWFHEGEGADTAAEMVRVWRGSFHRLAPGGKALYHAGAAVLSNHTVALFDAAVRLFEAAGVPRAESRAPLAALLLGTAENLAAVGAPRALTGPVARGDAATVRRHLDALAAAAPELVESYVALARRALAVAREKGSVPPDAAAEIARLLGAPDA